jgi:hypothetical protein
MTFGKVIGAGAFVAGRAALTGLDPALSAMPPGKMRFGAEGAA